MGSVQSVSMDIIAKDQIVRLSDDMVTYGSSTGRLYSLFFNDVLSPELKEAFENNAVTTVFHRDNMINSFVNHAITYR